MGKPFISMLQDIRQEQNERIQELENILQNLAEYLALPKFEQETWVSKYDILRMIGRY